MIDAPVVAIDLPAYIKQIREEEAWKKYDRNSITVFKSADLRIVLGGLHSGAEMIPHTAEGMMSIQVLEGELNINTDYSDTRLQTGHVLAIHKGTTYSVKAANESIYLLTMSQVGEQSGFASPVH